MDKSTKAPFPVSEQIAAKVHQAGLQSEHGISLIPGNGVADGKDGDVILLAPAYNITQEEIELIVERLETVVNAVFKEYQ